MNQRNVKNIKRLIRRHIASIEPYKPIEPLEVLADKIGISPDKIIKLDGNENLYGCSPRIQKALEKYSLYHIYPDSAHQKIRKSLEGYVGVDAEYIVVGSGSDELIDLILRLFLESGDIVINCMPTFGMYPYCTSVNNGEIVEINRDSEYALDITRIKEVATDRAKVIFIATPNNPTGNITPVEDILELLDTGIVVVVDEAYYEFCGISMASLVPQYENLIVLRSFSKWAGLAGLRVGYGIFHSEIIKYINRIKPPYNVNAAAQIAVIESLADIDYMKSRIKNIVAERGRLFNKLKDQRILEPIPSQANFILCRSPQGQAKRIKQSLEKKGIIIRYFDTPLLDDMLRISVGKPEHTDALVEALQEIGGSGNG